MFGAGAAAPAPPDGLEVHLGFDGAVKLGVPVPLEVALPPPDRQGPAEMVFEAPALGPQEGPVVTSTVVPFSAVAGAPRVVHVPVEVGDPRRPVTIRVSVAGKEWLRRTVAVSPEQVAGRLLVVVTDDRREVPSLRLLPGRVSAVSVSAGALPRLWQEYGAVDLVVFPDLDRASLDAAQQDALRQWVSLGGRLLIIARHAGPLSPSLDALLPAAGAEVRTLAGLPAVAAAYGGVLSGPLTVTTLAPRPGVRTLTDDGRPLMASWDVGMGRVTVWGVDPWQPAFLGWSARLRWWDAALEQTPESVVDPAALAGKLTVETPLDPLVHTEVAGAVVVYIGLVLALLRWRPSPAGVVACVLIAGGAVWGFSALAEAARARSATLVQATVLEPVSGMGVARATSVAEVAVPYGGPYGITVSRGMIPQPLTPSARLRIEFSPTGTELSGALRPGEPARPFQALGMVPVPMSIGLSPDGRRLIADMGSLTLRHVQLRQRDRVYHLRDLPAGSSVTAINPDGWAAAAAEAGTGSDPIEPMVEAIFQAPGAGAILGGTMPVLAAEVERASPVFALRGAAGPGRRVTILIMPLPLAPTGGRR